MSQPLVPLAIVLSALCSISLSCLYPAQPVIKQSTGDFLYCHPKYGPSCPNATDCQYRWLGYYVCCDQQVPENPLIGAKPILLNSGILEVVANVTSLLTTDHTSSNNNNIWSNIWDMLTKPHSSNQTFPGKVVLLNASEFAFRNHYKINPSPPIPIVLENGKFTNVTGDFIETTTRGATVIRTIDIVTKPEPTSLIQLNTTLRNVTNETAVDINVSPAEHFDNFTLPSPPTFVPTEEKNDTSTNQTISTSAPHMHFYNTTESHNHTDTFITSTSGGNLSFNGTTFSAEDFDLVGYLNEYLRGIASGNVSRTNETSLMSHFNQTNISSSAVDTVNPYGQVPLDLISQMELLLNATVSQLEPTPKAPHTSKRPKLYADDTGANLDELTFHRQQVDFQMAVDSALMVKD